MGIVYFHDLPVYRLAQGAYYKARDEYVENALSPSGTPRVASLRNMAENEPDSFRAWRSHLQQSYGGCWEFNEIVGYIRLHFIGTQARGEYFASPKKRIVRSRKKVFEYKTWKLAPEAFIAPPRGNAEILVAVRKYIEGCKRELPRRYVDTSVFDALALHIDWVGLLRESNT